MIEIKYSPESIADLQRVVEFVEVNPYAARRIAIDLQEGVSKLQSLSLAKCGEVLEARLLFVAMVCATDKFLVIGCGEGGHEANVVMLEATPCFRRST